MNKRVLLFDIIKLFAIYLAVWIVLSGGKLDFFALFFISALSIGTPFVFRLDYKEFNLKGILELAIFFIIYSIKSGFMVAKLAIKPNLHLKPIIYEMTLKTKTPFASSMLANIYSLMPGTVSMGMYDDKLILHIIDIDLFDKEFMEITQYKVLKAFEGELNVSNS
ncbi:Na+/H+ antiporter subunit E [Arcobacter sp. FWKO B]|uniref:Na+/H+ antiporter subunit E n=1 Tax=Arcobacter sp. FWKO B TaxID=2593672 RepID=UPI0018A3FEDE|nr:Na+/H+ antiporter subunit E [Arcobacter sp. FWKO B]QOG13151.1 hypothetical protein FWKOB_10820 [Arcobacter sp. FWKO B]